MTTTPFATMPDPTAAPPTAPLRTIVLEQERMPLDALTRILSTEPGLSCVGSGRTIEALEGHRPDEVDVVLLGAHLPGLDLVGAIAVARRRFPAARVVALAGYVDDQLHRAATTAGADAVLDTSTPLARLLEVLRTGEPLPALPDAPLARERRSRHLADGIGITPRQFDVLRGLATGRTADQVARSLDITVSTCRDHIKALHRVLSCSTTAEVLVTSSRLGLLPELGRPYR